MEPAAQHYPAGGMGHRHGDGWQLLDDLYQFINGCAQFKSTLNIRDLRPCERQERHFIQRIESDVLSPELSG